MKFISKNSSLHLYLLLIIILGILTPYISYANRADYAQDSIEIVCREDCNDSNNTLQLRGVKGGLRSSNVQTRGFEMRRSANNYIAKDGSSVPIGQVLTYEKKGPGYDAKGTWFFLGGEFDSPDMNGQWYKLVIRDKSVSNKFGAIKLKVNPPENQDPDSFTTTGPVRCDNSTRVCTTTGVGNATITLNFPATTAQVRGDSEGGNRPEDSSEFKFRRTSYTYRFSVYNPNSAPTVSCIAPSNISYTTAEARWSYSDPDGDAQTNANIQVATNPNFNANSIVADFNANGNGTTKTIGDGNPNSGNPPLSQNTKYYTRVRVKNAVNDWTGFSTCPGSFNTPSNNPPNLDRLSCSATSGATDYERARLEWNYTGTDEPGDELVLKARYRRNPEDTAWTTLNLPNNATGARNINNLISGFTYQVQVSLNDKANSHLGDRWKECRQVTPPKYPEPKVTYSISKTGDASTAKTNGQTLVLKTGERVNANWSINNGTEVGLESCTLSITGQPEEQDFKNSLSFTGPGDGLPSRNINGVQVPTITADGIYDVTLKCTGKPAKNPVGVNQEIKLTVESYPTVSCSVDGNNTLQAGQTNVNIKATVRNVIGYSWNAGINNNNNINQNNQTGSKSGNLNPDTLTFPLTYNNTEFVRYTPWLQVTNSSNGRKSDIATCGRVTNLGDSNIKEVR